MSDYSYIADRAKKAFSSVSRLEIALEKAPGDRALEANLASMRRVAERASAQLYSLAEINRIEVCNYRLLPMETESYGLEHVANSFLQYQYLFSQVYDAKKRGPKNRTGVPRESEQESALDFAYSYSGSLGVVLLARSERSFFSGSLDEPIDALYQVLDVEGAHAVRDIAHALGTAVVKRVHDWSYVNVNGGFSADIRWKRSDGKELGEVIDRSRMERIVGYVGEASEEKTTRLQERGTLVGIDVNAGTFHFVVPGGDSFKGRLSKDFQRGKKSEVPRAYLAQIARTEKLHFATERLETHYELEVLTPMAPASEVLPQ